jgi:hypothetical protein
MFKSKEIHVVHHLGAMPLPLHENELKFKDLAFYRETVEQLRGQMEATEMCVTDILIIRGAKDWVFDYSSEALNDIDELADKYEALDHRFITDKGPFWDEYALQQYAYDYRRLKDTPDTRLGVSGRLYVWVQNVLGEAYDAMRTEHGVLGWTCEVEGERIPQHPRLSLTVVADATHTTMHIIIRKETLDKIRI